MQRDSVGKLDHTPSEPLYKAVKQHIIAGIRVGEWIVGERLPSEIQLVKLLGISKMTVNRAYRELAAEGLIERVPALGSFVAEARPPKILFEVRDIAEDIRAHGGEYTCDVITLDRATAPGSVRGEDSPFPPDAMHSVLLHKRDGLPVQIEERWVNPDLFPDYLLVDFSKVSSFRYLSSIPPTEIEHTIMATAPTAQEQALFGLSRPEACLLLTRRTWSGRHPIAASRLTSVGSRYAVENRFKVAGPSASRS